MPTSEEIVWAAGILEGEGSFMYSEGGVGKRRRKLRIRVSMTDIDVIIKMRNILNPGGSFHRDERSVQTFKDGYKRKDTYILEIEGFKAEAVMNMILPYMGTRRSERINDCLWRWNNNRLGPVIHMGI